MADRVDRLLRVIAATRPHRADLPMAQAVYDLAREELAKEMAKEKDT